MIIPGRAGAAMPRWSLDVARGYVAWSASVCKQDIYFAASTALTGIINLTALITHRPPSFAST